MALAAAGCATSRTTDGPTFAQPPAPSATAAPPATGTPTGTPTAAPATSATPAPTRTRPRYVFPVRGGNVSYHPTHSAYPGTDIFADCGTPVVAVADGQVLEVSRVDRYRRSGPQGPLNGGKSVAILGTDGVRYYGSHLTEVAGGLAEGVRVRAGQQIGTVGRTGNANNVCHLHFGISPPCERAGDWWIRRGVIWPAGYLDAWRRNNHRSPADEVTKWHRERGCPPAPRSA
nr:M23 family metallopeptidase [Micromonospora sp. DSM 115978]